MIPALLTAICFAGAALSARQSTTLIGPFRANSLRLLVAVVVLGGICLTDWQTMPAGIGNPFLLAGGIGFGLGGFCMMQSLKRLGSPRSLLYVESGTAILAGFLAWVLLDDHLGLPQLLACGVILGGVAIAGRQWIKQEKRVQGIDPKGYAYAAGAALFQAVSLVISRGAFLEAAAQSVSVGKFSAAFYRLIGGLLIALLLLGLYRLFRPQARERMPLNLFPRQTSLMRQPLLWVSANALFGPILGVTFWLWAVSIMNPGMVQAIAATAPLISIPVSRKLEGNSLNPAFYLGAPVAIAGISLLVLC